MPDAFWNWTGTGFSAPRTVPGTFRPYVGDFDGNGRDDIFWYAPGPTADKLWLHAVAGGYSSLPIAPRTTVAVGDFDGDHRDDIVWYAPGSAGDSMWFGGAGGTFAPGYAINRTYIPVASLDGTGRDGLISTRPARRPTAGGAGRPAGRCRANRWPSPCTKPVVGAFSAGGADGILWYAPARRPTRSGTADVRAAATHPAPVARRPAGRPGPRARRCAPPSSRPTADGAHLRAEPPREGGRGMRRTRQPIEPSSGTG